MIKFNIFILSLVFIINLSCSKVETIDSSINEKNLDLQVYEAYKEGVKSLEDGDALYAAKKFNEAEILFPQSEWAPKSSLMAAYAYYSQDYYGDAIAELRRFIKIYSVHNDLDYAYYLLAICYYEQIVDEKKDLKSIIDSKKTFEYLIKNYPNTDYALDANFKLGMINEILASKEMYIGRYYFKKQKWIPAINRFKVVIDEYETTIYVEEAIHRMVELNYKIGLKSEAEKYAKLLGYNYQSSKWYEMSYTILNKKYKRDKINKDKKNNVLIKKFKSLLN